VVAGFEWLTVEAMLDHVMRASPWVQACAIGAALPLCAAILRVGGRVSPATADLYIQRFHDGGTLRLRELPVRMAAALAALGLGVPMGLEGPSLYAGATIGSRLQRRFERLLRNKQTLLVAGAAAGVSAIFRAPATGAVFALEVPYREDLGRRLLLPSLVGAATGYLTFAGIHGTARLFVVQGTERFTFRDLLGAIAVGAVAGSVTRGFAWMIRRAKRISTSAPLLPRLVAATATLVALFVAGRLCFGESLVISPGYNAITWATDIEHGWWLVAVLLALRCIGTATAVAGGGTGGLFIPLVVTGALTGRLIGGAFNALDHTLYTVLGVAAALGAGYRVPLAAVMFVAEVTGRPEYVVPGLLAAVAADLVMLDSSVTTYQRGP
jgi:CIC family chloride channel protein